MIREIIESMVVEDNKQVKEGNSEKPELRSMFVTNNAVRTIYKNEDTEESSPEDFVEEYGSDMEEILNRYRGKDKTLLEVFREVSDKIVGFELDFSDDFMNTFWRFDLTEPLDKNEIKELADAIEGQCSDGIGESIEDNDFGEGAQNYDDEEAETYEIVLWPKEFKIRFYE